MKADRIEARNKIAVKKALAWFRKRHFVNAADDNTILIQIAKVALMHPDKVSSWMQQLASYADQEGFENQTPLIHARIAERPEYRRVKILG